MSYHNTRAILQGIAGNQGSQGPENASIIKRTGISLTQSTWTFSTPYWNYTYSDGAVDNTDSIIFTPANSTISIVIYAVVLPQITTATASFILYSQNQPSGNIDGEYLIIKL